MCLLLDSPQRQARGRLLACPAAGAEQSEAHHYTIEAATGRNTFNKQTKLTVFNHFNAPVRCVSVRRCALQALIKAHHYARIKAYHYALINAGRQRIERKRSRTRKTTASCQ